MQISSPRILRPSELKPKQLLLCCLCLFILALGVRLLVWRDRGTIAIVHHGGMTKLFYRPLAEPLIKGDIKTFLAGPNPPNDATVIGHPPGYPLLFAFFSRIFSTPETRLQLFQLALDCSAVALVFLLASEFFPTTLGLMAAALVALAPNVSFYSLLLIPDTLIVPPVLAALLLLIRAYKKPTLLKIVAAGALLGLSCWLRANILLLAPFLAIFILTFFREQRWRYAGLLVASSLLVISPITLRNYLVFGHFIPISLGSGMVLTEGIAENDLENRFDLSATDAGVSLGEARKFNRPDYATGLWNVDGIEREKRRTNEALAIIKAHPVWYLSTAARRAKRMLESDPLLPDTTIIPQSHLDPADIEKLDAKLSWSQTPVQFLSSQPETLKELKYSLAENQQQVEFTSSPGVYPELVRTSEIPVAAYTTYKLTVPVKTVQGRIILSVTDSDHNVLATTITPDPIKVKDSSAPSDAEVVIPFRSGSAQKVFLVMTGSSTPVWSFGTISAFRVGRSSAAFSLPFRWMLYEAQQTLRSGWLVPFATLGILTLVLVRRGRELALLLVVPLYFILVGSLAHMEHRYIVVIYYLLPILAVVPVYFLAGTLPNKIAFYRTEAKRVFQSRMECAKTLLPNETIADAADGEQVGRLSGIFFNIFS
jgi:hypothetical protein